MSDIILEVTGLKNYMRKRKKKFLSEFGGAFASGLMAGLLAKPISEIIAYVYKNMRSRANWACRKFTDPTKHEKCLLIFHIKTQETIIAILNQKMEQAIDPSYKNKIHNEITQRLSRIEVFKQNLAKLSKDEKQI